MSCCDDLFGLVASLGLTYLLYASSGGASAVARGEDMVGGFLADGMHKSKLSSRDIQLKTSQRVSHGLEVTWQRCPEVCWTWRVTCSCSVVTKDKMS